MPHHLGGDDDTEVMRMGLRSRNPTVFQEIPSMNQDKGVNPPKRANGLPGR